METVDLKLVLLGQPGVGKTCLVYRYLYNTFGETISTIGASFAMKKVEPSDGGRPCNLGIWDTAGQERFDSLSSFYCRGARAAIICFDLTDRASFECVTTKWIRKVMDEAEQGCHICIVGTKLDLVQAGAATRAVKADEIEALAQKHHAHWFETSAKQGEGVAQIFEKIVRQYHSRANAGDVENSEEFTEEARAISGRTNIPQGPSPRDPARVLDEARGVRPRRLLVQQQREARAQAHLRCYTGLNTHVERP